MTAREMTKLDEAIRSARKKAYTASEGRDALAMLAAETELKLLDKKLDFVRFATRLAESLMQTVERVEEEPYVHHWINPLGEVLNSSNSLDADRAAVEVGALRQMLDKIASARKEAERSSGGGA